ILYADKEGFLRSERFLIQTMGRASRNQNEKVIMYAAKITASMQVAIDETNRRRPMAQEYNEKHGKTPTTIQTEVRYSIRTTVAEEDESAYGTNTEKLSNLKGKEKTKANDNMEKEMKEAAKSLNFEKAAELRDLILELKAEG